MKGVDTAVGKDSALLRIVDNKIIGGYNNYCGHQPVKSNKTNILRAIINHNT